MIVEHRRQAQMGWSMKARNRRTARSAKVTARLAGMAVLALVASGCSGAEPGVVAYVGDTKITQRQLDEALAGVTATLPDQQIPSAAVADALIQGAIADRIAAANNIVITDSDRDALLKGSNLAPLVEDPRAKVVAYDAVDPELVARKLGTDAYVAARTREPVTLNPRFGVLDPDQKTIVSDQSGSLARPVVPQTP